MTTFCAQTSLKSTQMQKLSRQPSSGAPISPIKQSFHPQPVKARKIRVLPRRIEAASMPESSKQIPQKIAITNEIPSGRQSFARGEEVAVKSSEESQRPVDVDEHNDLSLTVDKEGDVSQNKSPSKFNLNLSGKVHKDSSFGVLYNRRRPQRPEEVSEKNQGNLENPSPSTKKDELYNLRLNSDLEAGPYVSAVETPQRPILVESEDVNAQERIETNPAQNSINPILDRDFLLNIDAEMYLRQICISLLFIILTSIVTTFMISNDLSSHRWIFTLLYAFFVYLAIENIIRMQLPEVQDWKKAERAFDLFEIGAFLIFLGLLDFYFSRSLTSTIRYPFPLVLVTVVYCFASKAPRSLKSLKILTKSAICLQAFLIMAKLNGLLDWEWRFTFVLLWIYFGVTGTYSIIITLTVVGLIICSIFKIESIRVHYSKDRIVGMTWYSLYYGLSIVGVVGLAGICEILDDKKSANLFEFALALGSFLSCFLLIFTLVMFKSLKEFMKVFDQLRNFSGVGIDLANSKLEMKKHILDFEVNKNLRYFTKISSTYFKPLEQTYLPKNKLIKKKIVRLVEMSQDVQKDAIKDKLGIIKSLKQAKQILDSKLKIIPIPSPKKAQQKVQKEPLAILSFDIKSVNRNLEMNEDQEGNQCPKHAIYQFQDRRFFTADNISDCKETQTGNVAQEGENLCYVCVEREANAILMDCGHGGICYDCAVNMICQKNECMECRKPVKTIYKIISFPKNSEVFTGLLEAKVVELVLNP